MSEAGPLSSETAKLLDISKSDINANDDWVEAVEVVEVVRSRPDGRDVLGSSCHMDAVVSTSAYRRP